MILPGRSWAFWVCTNATLEDCIGVKNAVKGFVPPFSRPMTWLKKGAFSFGDRAIGPAFRGNDIQKIIEDLKVKKLIYEKDGATWFKATE